MRNSVYVCSSANSQVTLIRQQATVLLSLCFSEMFVWFRLLGSHRRLCVHITFTAFTMWLQTVATHPNIPTTVAGLFRLPFELYS